ncbi:MAG: invasion associated locus B family protein [Rhodobacteraceae bacterium]|nr:invasion associated locus B family protein [Paracoccaceae bacterium]
MSCPDSESTCVLAQTVASTDRNWLATLRIALSNSKTGAPAIIQFLVPPNVHLASGLFSTVAPDAPLEATFLRCSVKACEAVMAMDVATLRAWKRGRTAEVRYRPAADMPPVVFDVSLMGLTAGLIAAEGAN